MCIRDSYRAVERELTKAEARGYNPKQASPDSAREQYLLGLYIMTKERLPGYPSAIQAIERAITLDPGIREAWYTLYQMRSATGEHELAEAALEEFRRGLTLGDPQTQYAAALAQEQRGQVQ